MQNLIIKRNIFQEKEVLGEFLKKKLALLRHFQEGGLGGGRFFGAKAPEKDNFTKNTGSSYYNKTFQGVF